jgi:hypothetical protein
MPRTRSVFMLDLEQSQEAYRIRSRFTRIRKTTDLIWNADVQKELDYLQAVLNTTTHRSNLKMKNKKKSTR